MTKSFFAILMYGVFCSSPAYAQQVPTDDPVATAPIRLGAVGLDPHIGLTNFGIDTNVFNSTVDAQQDFTFTVTPGTDLWLRTGRGLLTLTGNVGFVYFHEFSSQRSINGDAFGQYEFRFNKLRPYASASYLDTHERPGFEIDARAQHFETEYHAGTDFRIASKSTARLDFRHLKYQFAGDEVFNGQALYQELNRTLKAVEVSWRQRLTALTTWVTRFTSETERFEYEDFRNSDSFRVSSGFELGRFALIRGSAFAGYRKLTPADGGILPEFSGITAAVSVSYTMPTQTRLGVNFDRDVQYSYESRTPYYVQTGWTATLTQRVTGRWDVQFSGGRDRLAYQAITSRDARTDFIGRYGGGIGYAIGDQVRAGFDVQSFYRSSVDPRREYGSIRAGLSVTYGY